jgi:hypothetical protein
MMEVAGPLSARHKLMEAVMGRDKRWREATTGPDELDVETMMRALGALHSGHVGLTVSPSGTGSTGGVYTEASMTFDVLPGSALPDRVGVSSAWPCREHRTFWGHIYALLVTLDWEISKVYKQESLWDSEAVPPA